MMTLQRIMPTTEAEELPSCCWPAGRVETFEPQSHILTTHIKIDLESAAAPLATGLNLRRRRRLPPWATRPPSAGP